MSAIINTVLETLESDVAMKNLNFHIVVLGGVNELPLNAF